MIVKSRAIVLRCVKYADQKVIVDFYTETHGRITCGVKLSATPKGKMQKRLFQPLTSLLIEIDYRANKQMQRLTDLQMDVAWTSLTVDPVKASLGMFLAEVLCNVTRQEQEDVPLYQFIMTSMQWLDLTDGSVANFHIAFLIRLTRYLGFLPVAEDYSEGNIFDLRTGEFPSVAPLHHDFLAPVDASRMYQLLRISYPTMHLFRMSRQERRQCLDTIMTYYRLHLPSFPQPKSLGILYEMFDGM